jgi:condensin complex subunit 3
MPGRARQSDRQINADYLSSAIPKIFDQVQVSIANHQKNCVALHKVHSEAAGVLEPINNGRSYKLVGERMFDDLVHQMLINVLSLKKGTTTADRVVKFIGAYTKFINEKGK